MLKIQPEAIHFEWDFNPATLPNSSKLLEGTKHIDAQLALIKKHLKENSNNTIADGVFEQLVVEHLSTPNVVSILIWISFGLLGTVLIVAIVLWWRSRSLATTVASQQQQYEMAFVTPSGPPMLPIQHQASKRAF